MFLKRNAFRLGVVMLDIRRSVNNILGCTLRELRNDQEPVHIHLIDVEKMAGMRKVAKGLPFVTLKYDLWTVIRF